MNKTIGNNLRKIRKQKGWSQEQVADFLYISQSAYARMESGDSHSWASHLDKILEVFETTTEDLLNCENLVVGNIGTNNGVGYAEVVNQLSEKLIIQFEKRIEEKDNIIIEKDKIILEQNNTIANLEKQLFSKKS